MMRRFTDRTVPWRWVFGLPIAAAAVHIIATLAAVTDQRASAYTQLSALLKPNTMTVLDPVLPGQQPLPFLTSDVRYAMCPFSTSTGSVRVTAQLPDTGWSVGVLRADGSSAYFASAAPGRRTAIALTIVPDDTRFLGLTPQARGRVVDAGPQLSVAAADGLVVIRAPDKGPAYDALASSTLARASCTIARD